MMKTDAEAQRLVTMFALEREAGEQGFSRIAGADEVGRGALAGPIVAAAVIVGDFHVLRGVKDSKQLSAKARERLADVIKGTALAWTVHEVSAKRIDAIGIQEANRLVILGALEKLAPAYDLALVDGTVIPSVSPSVRMVIKGDKISLSIAAASIVAKVHRDLMMSVELHRAYPLYGFDSHKGYGSSAHISALRTHGLCPEHRRSFAPCRHLLEAEGAHEEN